MQNRYVVGKGVVRNSVIQQSRHTTPSLFSFSKSVLFNTLRSSNGLQVLVWFSVGRSLLKIVSIAAFSIVVKIDLKKPAYAVVFLLYHELVITMFV